MTDHCAAPATEGHLDVFRKHSTTRPIPHIGGPEYEWRDTALLNLALQYFTYRLVVAVCTRLPGMKKLTVVRRFDQRVYASPSRRQMDAKVGFS